MPTLLVVSDQSGAGKTAFCAGLSAELQQPGRPVSTFKSLTTNSNPDADAHVSEHLFGEQRPRDPVVVPPDGLSQNDMTATIAARDRALENNRVVVMEISSSLSKKESAQTAEALDSSVILVLDGRQGIEVPKIEEWCSALGKRLLGVVINGVTRYRGHETRVRIASSLRSQGLIPLGTIPEDRGLLGVTVGHLASHLQARFLLNEEMSKGLVEHIMVGGMGMDSGTLYFSLHQNKAVVVRGDRPDVQMAALATPTTCMVLTAGIEPIEYVLNEAEQEEVPLMIVDSGTLETMATLATVQEGVLFDHPAKLERMSTLIRDHIDVALIETNLGLTAST